MDAEDDKINKIGNELNYYKHEEVEDDSIEEQLCDIPGLQSRVKNPLEFLGLDNTVHDACQRFSIPAIKTMLGIINDRLTNGLHDDVLEIAWFALWNGTDESPINCERFLDERGMDYFQKCLMEFPDKEELLGNMMGVLGNVAEVANLRPRLVKSDLIETFTHLLDSTSDGIEVSYNAAGVVSHIASDGIEAWTIETPAREHVLDRMVAAIQRWDLTSKRIINYRSFKPILRLLQVYHTPECQLWGVWALANLTKVTPDKYCPLVEEEGGLTLLEQLSNSTEGHDRTVSLAKTVIDQCKQYKMTPSNINDPLASE